MRNGVGGIVKPLSGVAPYGAPSVLPDISPTSGEIGNFAAGASTVAVVAPVVTRRGVDATAMPPRLRSAAVQAH
ncbi:hypothetical protein FJ934_09685 [Mesorhizobium sp. B2-4-12]|nr:hypothetical protein FJ934_09685 [Mesorhizobium sp. B2-4-12]